MAVIRQRIIPNLWFDREAEEAANFYTSLFDNSRIGSKTRASRAGFEITGLPEGTAMTIEFEIEGMRFIGINGGPLRNLRKHIPDRYRCSKYKGRKGGIRNDKNGSGSTF